MNDEVIHLELATRVEVLSSSQVGFGWEFSNGRLRLRQPGPEDIHLGIWESLRPDSPSELVSRFLAVERGDVNTLLAFLESTGIWEEYDDNLDPEYLWQKQDDIRAVVTRKKWGGFKPIELLQDLIESIDIKASFDVGSGDLPAGLTVRLTNTWSAIVFACWMEWARTIKRRYCARQDCPHHGPGRVPFIPNRPDMRYCDKYCAQLEHLRASRKLARQRRKR